jgi:hypothetical protein
MNRKQFIILLVAVVLVGAAGWVVYNRGQQSWHNAGSSAGGKLLPNLSVNDVAQITIQAGTNELTLARLDHRWRVRQRGDYPADFSKISDLLMKFRDLKTVQTEEVGAPELARFDLLPPGAAAHSATRLAFENAQDKTLAAVLLGKKHMKQPTGNSSFDEGWPDGRYLMTDNNTQIVAVVSDPLDDVDPNPASWLDKGFFSIQNPRAVAVQFPQATNSWKLVRASETNDWELADASPGEKLDSSKLYEVTHPFSSPSFDDVLPGAPPLTNATVLTAQTFDGFDYTVKIGQQQNDDFPLTLSVAATLPTEPVPPKNITPEEKKKQEEEFQKRHQELADKLAREKELENWTYLVPSYLVEPLLKPRNELLATNATPAVATKSGK